MPRQTIAPRSPSMLRGDTSLFDALALSASPAPHASPISLVAACSLRLSALHLCSNPPLVRPSRRFCLAPPLRTHGGLREHLPQPFARGVPVGRLRSVLAALDHQHAIARHPAAGQRRKPLLDVRGQRGSGNVDAQLDCGRHFVHVLAARTGGTHEPFLDIGLVDSDLVGDADRRVTTRLRDVPTSHDRRGRRLRAWHRVYPRRERTPDVDRRFVCRLKPHRDIDSTTSLAHSMWLPRSSSGLRAG